MTGVPPCPALQENDALISFKKQIEVLRKAQEAAFVEQQRQALEAADAAELAKFEEMRRRALEQKAIQTQQLDDLRVREGKGSWGGRLHQLLATHATPGICSCPPSPRALRTAAVRDLAPARPCLSVASPPTLDPAPDPALPA